MEIMTGTETETETDTGTRTETEIEALLPGWDAVVRFAFYLCVRVVSLLGGRLLTAHVLPGWRKSRLDSTNAAWTARMPSG